MSPTRSSKSTAKARSVSTGLNGVHKRVVSACLEDRPRTKLELSRERAIRDDPLAEVINPLWVVCRACETRIKLSPKSYFDLFHWTKHRERCVRRNGSIVESVMSSLSDSKDGGDDATAVDSEDTVSDLSSLTSAAPSPQEAPLDLPLDDAPPIPPAVPPAVQDPADGDSDSAPPSQTTVPSDRLPLFPSHANLNLELSVGGLQVPPPIKEYTPLSVARARTEKYIRRASHGSASPACGPENWPRELSNGLFRPRAPRSPVSLLPPISNVRGERP